MFIRIPCIENKTQSFIITSRNDEWMIFSDKYDEFCLFKKLFHPIYDSKFVAITSFTVSSHQMHTKACNDILMTRAKWGQWNLRRLQKSNAWDKILVSMTRNNAYPFMMFHISARSIIHAAIFRYRGHRNEIPFPLSSELLMRDDRATERMDIGLRRVYL